MRNYWDPNFYSESRHSSIVMHYEMHMKDPVDGAILTWAVNHAVSDIRTSEYAWTGKASPSSSIPTRFL